MGTWILIVGLAAVGAAVAVVLLSRRSRQGRDGPRRSSAYRVQSSPSVAKLVAEGRLREAMEMLLEQRDYKGAARVALRMGDPLRAAELFERGNDLEAAANAFMKIPDYRRAAECYGRAGMHQEAAELYVKLEDLWTAAEELVAAGKAGKAAALHRQLGNDSLAAKLEGDELRSQGRFKEAADKYREAGEIELCAECLEEDGTLLEAGNAYLEAGSPEKAARCSRRPGPWLRLHGRMRRRETTRGPPKYTNACVTQTRK